MKSMNLWDAHTWPGVLSSVFRAKFVPFLQSIPARMTLLEVHIGSLKEIYSVQFHIFAARWLMETYIGSE